MPRTTPSQTTPIIEARGSAIESITADQARLTLKAVGQHQIPSSAYRRRDAAISTVKDVLTAIAGKSTSAITTEAERLDEFQVHSDQVQASWQLEVVVSAAHSAELRELVSRLAGVEDIHLNGPQWTLSLGARKSARSQVLAAAAQAAQEDAETLALAMGGSLGSLVYLSTQDTPGIYRAETAAAQPMMARATSGVLPPRTLELDLRKTLQPLHYQLLDDNA